MRDTGRHREQAIDQPVLAGHERRMRWTRQPLAQADNVLQSSFLRSDRESDRALNHVWIERRAVIGALNISERIGQAFDISDARDRNLSALRFQSRCGHLLGAPKRGRNNRPSAAR
jgi:hypothetical protein